jgi:hypothetical protein
MLRMLEIMRPRWIWFCKTAKGFLAKDAKGAKLREVFSVQCSSGETGLVMKRSRIAYLEYGEGQGGAQFQHAQS